MTKKEIEELTRRLINFKTPLTNCHKAFINILSLSIQHMMD